MVLSCKMCFCAITLGIVRFGDISTFSVVGKWMIKVFLLISFILALLNTAWIVPRMFVGASSAVSLELYAIFEILISYVPNNILSPILEFNSVHIIFIGIMFGIAMLVMGHKADPLTELMDELNTVAVLTNGCIDRFIPIYVGMMVFALIASGQIAVLSGFLQLFVMVVIGELATLIGYTLYLCLKLKVPVRSYVKLGLPTEALTIIISLNAIFEFLTVAVNGYCLQSQVVLLGHSFGKLDLDRLRGNN